MIYAISARRKKFLESFDVPGADVRVPADPLFKVRFQKPRRADESFTNPGYDLLAFNAQDKVPDAGSKCEQHRNFIFHKLGWKALSFDPFAFIIVSLEKRNPKSAFSQPLTNSYSNRTNRSNSITVRDAFVEEWDIKI